MRSARAPLPDAGGPCTPYAGINGTLAPGAVFPVVPGELLIGPQVCKVLIWTWRVDAGKIPLFAQQMLPVWKVGGVTNGEPDAERKSPQDGTQWRWGRELTAYRPLELQDYQT